MSHDGLIRLLTTYKSIWLSEEVIHCHIFLFYFLISQIWEFYRNFQWFFLLSNWNNKVQTFGEQAIFFNWQKDQVEKVYQMESRNHIYGSIVYGSSVSPSSLISIHLKGLSEMIILMDTKIHQTNKPRQAPRIKIIFNNFMDLIKRLKLTHDCHKNTYSPDQSCCKCLLPDNKLIYNRTEYKDNCWATQTCQWCPDKYSEL